jgi:8-oxo-dGTP pyrophosphatase MutT (NUDIX family)
LKTKSKATVYVKHQDKILAFRHSKYPEVGLQVPSGTIEDGETPVEAAKRELFEESGIDLPLESFEAVSVLEHDMRPFKSEIHTRHFFQVEIEEKPAESWGHLETHSSSDYEEEEFVFEWVSASSNLSGALSVGLGKGLPKGAGVGMENIERPEYGAVRQHLQNYRENRLQVLLKAFSQFGLKDLEYPNFEQIRAASFSLLEHLAHHLIYLQEHGHQTNEEDILRDLREILNNNSDILIFDSADCLHVPSENYESPIFLAIGRQALGGGPQNLRDSLCRESLSLIKGLGMGDTCHGHFGTIILLENKDLFSASNSYTLSGVRSTIYGDFVGSVFRMGETILHEATHNWLNDCLRAFSVDLNPEDRWYSPWRKKLRPSVGMLQAGMVFARLIQYFKKGLESGNLDPVDALYAEKRLETEFKILKEHLPILISVFDEIQQEPLRSVCAEELNRAINIFN